MNGFGAYDPSAGLGCGPGGIDPRRGLDGTRVTLAGGNTAAQMLHPSTMPFERLYRKLPLSGMFSSNTTPSNPFSVTLGAYRVPSNMQLAIFNVSGNIFVPNGVVVGDVQPIAPQSLATTLGYAITIDGATPGNVQFQLEPSPILPTAAPGFPGGTGLTNPVQTPYGTLQVPFDQANEDQFSQSHSDNFGNAGGPGNATQPQRTDHYGAPNVPFTLYADAGQLVSVRAIIWRPIAVPIAFIEYSVQGLLFAQNPLREVLNSVKYSQSNAENIR